MTSSMPGFAVSKGRGNDQSRLHQQFFSCVPGRRNLDLALPQLGRPACASLTPHWPVCFGARPAACPFRQNRQVRKATTISYFSVLGDASRGHKAAPEPPSTGIPAPPWIRPGHGEPSEILAFCRPSAFHNNRAAPRGKCSIRPARIFQNRDQPAPCRPPTSRSTVTLDQMTAWRLVTKSRSREAIRAKFPDIRIEGDQELGSHVLDMVSMMA